MASSAMDDEGETNGQAPNGSPEQPHIRLACQACQRKKIKCDRNFPCGQCTRSSLHCVPSTRKPRARHAGKRAIDTELRTRISKLENLVESLSGEVGASEDTPGSDGEAQTEPKDASPAVGKYIGSPFWSSLTTEVQALRDALEDEQAEDEAELTTPSSASGPGNSTEYDLIICPPGSVYVMPGALSEPSPELSAALCTTFCDNVDRMFKIFHTPTLLAFLMHDEPYLGQEATAPCNKALKAAVWFAATNTLSETQSQMLFGQSRPDQLQQYRRMVDVAMAQADLMNTTDIATLQGFTTYVAASRLTDVSRRVWTMTAIIVRIAQAMGLHHESVARSPFEAELRRRLWHQIRFLDVFSCMDRGSEALIAIGSFDTPLPKNTNDSEFDPSSTTIPQHEKGLTEMSFALLAYDATSLTHRLTTPESKPGGDTWKQRLECADAFREEAQEQVLQYIDRKDPWQRMLYDVANSMLASMVIRAVRPMQKHVSSVPPRVDSPYVLQLALNSLKAGEQVQSDPETERWRWMMWVQWHALATAIAGLCSIRDTDLANEAWSYVEKAYARYARHVADARSGMLWRPIEKLYRKASVFRDHGTTTSSTTSPMQSMPHVPPYNNNLSYPTSTDFDNNAMTTQPNPPLPLGAMPTTGIMNSSMNLDFSNNMLGNPLDMGNSDMSWMDFERILEDMSNPADITLGDMQWPQGVPSGQDWPCPMHQDLM